MWINLLNRNCHHKTELRGFEDSRIRGFDALPGHSSQFWPPHWAPWLHLFLKLPCQLSLNVWVWLRPLRPLCFLIPQPQLSIEDLDIRLKPAFNGTQPLYPVSGSQIHANRCIVFTESNDVYVFLKKLPRSNATDSLTLWHCTWPTKQWIQSHTLHSKDVFLYAPCQDVSNV